MNRIHVEHVLGVEIGAAVVLILFVIVLVSVWVATGSCASPAKSPSKLSDLDRAVLLKTDAQIKLLQERYSHEADPYIKEQSEVLTRSCKAAGLTWQVDCVVDANTGSITKKQSAPAAPSPAAKK